MGRRKAAACRAAPGSANTNACLRYRLHRRSGGWPSAKSRLLEQPRRPTGSGKCQRLAPASHALSSHVPQSRRTGTKREAKALRLRRFPPAAEVVMPARHRKLYLATHPKHTEQARGRPAQTQGEGASRPAALPPAVGAVAWRRNLTLCQVTWADHAEQANRPPAQARGDQPARLRFRHHAAFGRQRWRHRWRRVRRPVEQRHRAQHHAEQHIAQQHKRLPSIQAHGRIDAVPQPHAR